MCPSGRLKRPYPVVKLRRPGHDYSHGVDEDINVFPGGVSYVDTHPKSWPYTLQGGFSGAHADKPEGYVDWNSDRGESLFNNQYGHMWGRFK